ncbi:hypothetical protein HNQ34_000895 [Anoxybacillus tepidamans]|uniref:YtkA-like domain-containing protein n=1 Tax=Anoxybacteroides tepidamans TaxID=265948 RepID=A0A7W8MUE2_9BACL|nr:hypothetical protein [Anoxybacillus tepidamans]
MRTKMIASVFSLLLLAAWENHKEAETMHKAVPIASAHIVQTMHVKHEVRGKEVFVECIVNNFSFKKGARHKKDGEGHIDVYLNGQKVNEVFTAAFVVKGLPAGKHTVRLELVHNDSTKYGVSHEFEVNIP